MARATAAATVGTRLRLQGRVAVVTGAAAGIGKQLALGVAREGATVVCLDVNGPGAERVSGQIRSSGGDATSVRCDITDFEDVQAALAQAQAAHGRVHILLANAGGTGQGAVPFLELDVATWHSMIDLNLNGAFNCGLVFARHMAEAGGGAIVFTASQLSEVARPGMSHYCAAKGGVRQLVRGMALDLGPLGIRVNAIAPGPTMTEANREQQERPEVRDVNIRNSVLGRIAEPEEMVGAAVYLASDEASFTTGTTLFVDGGYTIQ